MPSLHRLKSFYVLVQYQSSHNMYVRFSAGVYTTNDEFELEISGVTDQMFTPIKRVQMTRK